jgi:hypothetical protein
MWTPFTLVNSTLVKKNKEFNLKTKINFASRNITFFYFEYFRLELMELDLKKQEAEILKQREEEKIQLDKYSFNLKNLIMNRSNDKALLEEEEQRQREADAKLKE